MCACARARPFVCMRACARDVNSILTLRCNRVADVDMCLSSPCLSKGNCSDEVHGFTCSCRPGFAGRVCEIGEFMGL